MKIKNTLTSLSLAAVVALGITGCSSSDETLTITPKGLTNLGSNYVYEGWLIVNGSPKSAGRFNIDDSNPEKAISFKLPQSDVDNATKYVLTIEPANETGAALSSPSDTKILAADFSGDFADLTVSDSAALGTDFSTAAGKYIINAPTDNASPRRDEAGVWWLQFSGGTVGSGTASAGLTIPTLPSGWKYEGWAVIDGTPVSTGTFTSADGNDSGNPFSGPNAAPAFPGEDFIQNAPSGLTFPADLRGKTIVISVEPFPDNSSAPFLLKPLVKDIGSARAVGPGSPVGNMTNQASSNNPTARVVR